MKFIFMFFLVFAAACGQTVEESFTRDPGPLDLIRGEGHEQAILQALAADALVGIDAAGRPVPRLALRWEPQPWGLRSTSAMPGSRMAAGCGPRTWPGGLRRIQVQADASPSKKALLQGLMVSGTGARVDVRARRPFERVLLELARVPIAREGDPAMASGPYRMTRQGAEWRFDARTHSCSRRSRPSGSGWSANPRPSSSG